MYQFKDDINPKSLFWFEKKLILDKNWALLPKASMAIFPVIACHVNEIGVAWPSEQTIAILSGLSDKSVRKGIRGLEDFPVFKFSEYVTKRGKRSKKFYVDLPKEHTKGEDFPFYRFVLESGFWRQLKPVAKALYPVMKTFSYFDIEQYIDIEELEAEEKEFEDVYYHREYDFCEADLDVMIEHAGIHRTSLAEALHDLENKLLIETIVPNRWKVFLRTKEDTFFRRDYLNNQVLKSYRHLLD